MFSLWLAYDHVQPLGNHIRSCIEQKPSTSLFIAGGPNGYVRVRQIFYQIIIYLQIYHLIHNHSTPKWLQSTRVLGQDNIVEVIK